MSKFLLIEEEHGFQYWYAVLTDEEFEVIKKRWTSIQGLNCLVPVTFVVEKAKPIIINDTFFPINYNDQIIHLVDVDHFMQVIHMHMHDTDDSYLEGVDHEIKDGDFQMDGVTYFPWEVREIFHKHKEKNELLFNEISNRFENL
jgi:hypothetical protein